MWLYLAIGSAVLLGLYDVAKKQALRRNGVLGVLLVATALSTLLMLPFFRAGSIPDHLCLVFKAALVTASWVSGLAALGLLPITTVSTFKTSRPVFVLLLSILIYGERLNAWQWGGSLLALAAIWMLGRSSRSDAGVSVRRRGWWYMAIAVATGVASALWDKHILTFLEPLFVQSWTNLYITLMLGICVLWQRRFNPDGFQPVHWDWTLVVIALLITGADYLYFRSLHADGAMLSVISMIRRGSVIITFALGAALFHEKRVGRKALALAVMLAGITLIVIGSR